MNDSKTQLDRLGSLRSPFSTKEFRRRMAPAVAHLQSTRPSLAAGVISMQWLVILMAIGTVYGAKLKLTGTSALFSGWEGMSAPRCTLLAALLIVAAFVVLAKQHALGVLLHDASHGRLFKSRRLNDTVANWACGFPMFLSTAGYRVTHLPHHLFTNTESDPYWQQLVVKDSFSFPMRKRRLALLLVGDLFVCIPRTVGLLRNLVTTGRVKTGGVMTVSRADRLQLAALWLTILGLVAVTGTWDYFLLLWLVPRFSLLVPIDRIRMIAEHDLTGHANEFERTRIVRGTWIERQLLAPLNINYHVEHHLFSGVPFYRMQHLHRLLMLQPDYRDSVKIWPSYFFGNDSLFSSLTTCEVPDASRLVTIRTT